MRTLFLAASALLLVSAGDPAHAADVPAKAPIYRSQPPVAYSWTGFYLGGHVGAGWATNDWNASELTDVPLSLRLGAGSATGFLGGAQAGLNYQVDAMVFGLESDVSWAQISGESCNIQGAIHCTSKADRLGTITGRFGIVADRALVYLKGGATWLHDEHVLSIIASPDASVSGNKWGWTGGAGIEYALTHNWSAKLEYDFMDFGNKQLVFVTTSGVTTTPQTTTAEIKQRIQTVKFGLNYKFDWVALGAGRY
jgi:outer membrane immunogenic protein